MTARGAILGVDLGDRRIGLAIADDPTAMPAPLATIRRARTPAQDAATIARAVGGRTLAEVVVGLPLHIGGDEGTQAVATRSWAEAVATELGLPLVLRDERLSSHLAEQRVGPMKRGRSGGPPSASQREAWRARVDREAAAIILRDELDARARTHDVHRLDGPDDRGGREQTESDS